MATLVRWEPFREVALLQNEMSRFMNGLLEGNGRTNQAWVPALDVWETETEIVYALDLPGIPEDEISVELDDGALTISAERERTQEESEERFYRFERRYGTFSRTFGVPQGVTRRGLRHLEERAEQLGGRCEVRSSPRGTTIIWRVTRLN